MRHAGGEIDVDALIDSGASISLFRADVAESLGIKLRHGTKRDCIGISGKVKAFVHEVEIKIAGKWFPCKVGFSSQVTSSFNLLGRQTFFERYLITFNEKERKTILTEF